MMCQHVTLSGLFLTAEFPTFRFVVYSLPTNI